MKKRQYIVIGIFLIIILISNVVQARANLNLKITLPQEYIMQNPQQESMKQYYIQNHIYMHAVNDKKDESIIVVQLENDFTKQITNLAQLSESNLNTILEQYNEEKEQANQVKLKQEMYQKGELLFIDTIFEQTSNEKKVQAEEYYTIMEGKAVIISVNFLEKEVDTGKVRQIIEGIEISKEEPKEGGNPFLIAGILVFGIVLGILYVRKQTKVNVQLEEHEKKTVVQKITKQLERLSYDKLKGILVLFIVTLVLNSINLLYASFQILREYHWLQGITTPYKIYVGIVLWQNLVQLIGLILIGYFLTKRKPETIKKVQNTLLAMLIGVTILTILRLILQVSTNLTQDFVAYSISEGKILLKSALYILIWYGYIKNSIRVSVYYQEKSIEQVVLQPKKGYQANAICKRMMEVKIIDYFTMKKAFDYGSGIYMNHLPKEYAGSVALSNLTSKKILKLKRAKYYLNQKNLENPKGETRKTAKTVAMMVVIYILVILLIETF